MSTQLSNLNSTLVTGNSPRVQDNLDSAVVTNSSTTASPVPKAVTNMAPGNANWRYSTQLNEQLTSAQRAQDFLEQLSTSLQAVKSELSQALSQRRVDSQALNHDIQAVTQLWGSRNTISGGSIDSRLKFRLLSDAQRSFHIRGLNLSSLTSGQRETLTLYAGARNRPMTLTVGEDQSEEAILQQFSRALAPAGVSTQADGDGNLVFSAPEEIWNELNDKLAIQGGGIRFPAGQPTRIKAQTESEALTPEKWQVSEHSAAREALQQVVQALAQIEQAKAAIASAISHTMESINQLSHMDEQAWAANFVADFNANLNQVGNYQMVSDVIPALLGVSRYRVESLLSL